MAKEPHTPVQTLLSVIRVEKARREALMSDLLDLAERGQDMTEVRSALRQTEESLTSLHERLARWEPPRNKD